MPVSCPICRFPLVLCSNECYGCTFCGFSGTAREVLDYMKNENPQIVLFDTGVKKNNIIEKLKKLVLTPDQEEHYTELLRLSDVIKLINELLK